MEVRGGSMEVSVEVVSGALHGGPWRSMEVRGGLHGGLGRSVAWEGDCCISLLH